MKIFYIDPNNTTPRLNYPLILSLKKRRMNISFFTTYVPKITDYYEENYYHIADYFFFKYSNRIKTIFFRRLIKFISYPISLKKLLIKIKKEKADIVHFNWLNLPFCEYFFIKILHAMNVKIVLTRHNYFPHNKKKLRLFEKKIFQYFDRIICLSDFVKSEFTPELQKKVSVIEHGNCFVTEMKKFQPQTEEQNNTALFVGSIHTYKGVDLLIQAIAFLKKNDQLRNLKFRILGKSSKEYVSHLHKLIQEKKLQKNIILENRYLSYEEMFAEIHAADFCLLPYRSASQSSLPFLFAALEKPFLVTNVGGLSEFISEDFAQIVKPDSENIAQGIVELKNRIPAISSKAFRDFKENFSWQKTLAKYQQFYQDVL